MYIFKKMFTFYVYMLHFVVVPLYWLRQSVEREHWPHWPLPNSGYVTQHLLRWWPAEKRAAHPKSNWHYASSIPTLLDRFNYKVAYTGMADIYRTGIEPQYSVLFLDENNFNLTITDEQKWWWIHQEERYTPIAKSPDGHLGVVGVMVWKLRQLASELISTKWMAL